MFEKEAKRSFDELDDRGIGDDWSIEEAYENGFSNGGIFGYNILKEEFEKETEKLFANYAYARSIISGLLNNSDEYARQRAIDFLKENEND
jgi:hypothetical protein